jgi:nucleoside-diphosphate-sugar epimerase
VSGFNVKKVAVVGGNGSLGSAISNKLQASGLAVYKYSRKSGNSWLTDNESLQNWDRNNVKDALPKYFDAVFLTNRIRNNSEKNESDFSIEKFLRAKTNSTTLVINLATYIEKYSITSSAGNFKYQQEKIRQTNLLKNLELELKFKFINLYLFTVYGQKDESKSFFNQIMQAAKVGEVFPCTAGEQLISLTHIDDLLECIERILHLEMPDTGEYSFWATPPIKLTDVIDTVNYFSRPGFKVNFGLVPYGGHEMFKYKSELFPVQLYPEYLYLDLHAGIERFLEDD